MVDGGGKKAKLQREVVISSYFVPLIPIHVHEN